jgi:hypothetical protein
MGLGDVVDQLLDEHGLADARTTKQADLAALGIGRQKVDDLDARFKDLRFRRLLGEFRRRLVDRAEALGVDRTTLVDRVADDVEDAPERALADRPRTRPSEVSIAMQRTVFSPRCCATSITRRPSGLSFEAAPGFFVSSAFKIAGRCPSN